MEADGARIDEAFRTLVHRAGPEQARGFKQVVKQGVKQVVKDAGAPGRARAGEGGSNRGLKWSNRGRIGFKPVVKMVQ